MKVTDLMCNHLANPAGYHMEDLHLSWKVSESGSAKERWSRVQILEEMRPDAVILDTGEEADLHGHLDAGAASLHLKPLTKYYWKVTVCDEAGEIAESEIAWFRTAKDEKSWTARWIRPESEAYGRVGTRFTFPQDVESAVISVCGVGLYELYLDGEKVGDEYLAPGFNNYHEWIQFQTYELPALKAGEHRLDLYLGNGWYKGRYILMGPGIDHNKYGDTAAAILEMAVTFADESTGLIATDESWYAAESPIRADGLYDGETLDEHGFGEVGDAPRKAGKVLLADLGTERLTARYSVPVRIQETRKPVSVLHTPKGEVVLDFGQNMAGWVTFRNRLEDGASCSYQVGEILQNDCFYRENYRTAEAAFHYVSDGKEKWVRPHFTYYGFRYVLLTGFGDEVDPEDFAAEVLYSDMAATGSVETGNTKVNRLIANVHWGQKSNFIDVPTDCPQRDERLGWTGDAQVFSMTGLYNMNAAAFYRKFVRDIASEQKSRGGMVPVVIPNICFDNISSAAWSDSATIIPWNLYLMYGDLSLLREQYPAMKAWADYIHGRDELSGDTRLWSVDNHFGDWLAIGRNAASDPTGDTDMTLIATAYYYLSTNLCAKAARALGEKEEAEQYAKLAGEIRSAYQHEYVAPSGRLSEQTQTAYALTLQFGLGRDGKEAVLAEELSRLLRQNQNHLDTGFVGTPFLCPMLSRYGKNDQAYTLLLQEDYPSWLYPVNMGATTIWERWNSVMPDGTMNPEGMNSLNHYAYGSIEQWMYQYMLGIQPDEEQPGWEHFFLTPMPDERIGFAAGHYDSCRGRIVSKWKYQGADLLFHIEIPFGTTATVRLGDTDAPEMELAAGSYDYTFPANSRKPKGWSAQSLVSELKKNPETRAVLQDTVPALLFLPDELTQGTLAENMNSIFSGYSRLELRKVEEELRKL